jgi:hypothetical protein
MASFIPQHVRRDAGRAEQALERCVKANEGKPLFPALGRRAQRQ